MSLNVSAWAIRRPVPPIIAFIILMVVGWGSFMQLPITRFPNIDVPIIQAIVTQGGAAPVELESQVTKKIEDAVAGVNGIKHITSAVTEGSSVTTIEFRLEINSDRALNDVKDAVARVRSDLPKNIEEPLVKRLDIEGLPIVTYAVRAPGLTPEQVSWFVDDVIVRQLQGVKGVGSVNRVGGVDREIRVALDPDRLTAFGITAGDVNKQIRATNIDLAGGRGEIAGREQAIRTLAGKASVADLATTMIALPKGRKVQLDQLGTVRDGSAEARIFATYNTQPVVAFSIVRAKGASDTTVSADVDKAVKSIAKARPDVELNLIDTTTTAVTGSYEATMHTLLEGAALAILVVLVFLKDIRATIITAIALPLSIVPSYFVLDLLGFSLNLVSLLAITIATGILVDDAIVEIENIVRHMRSGKSAYRASLEAADEIGLAVMAITATIVAVFTPVSFMGGIAGQYFKQFGITVAVSVVFSLLVARFVTPMLGAYFLRSAGHEAFEPGWLRAYTRLVRWSVRHRFATVGLGLVIFAGSIGSFFLLPTAFIPADDSGRALLAIELPPGTMLEETRRVSNDLTRRLLERRDVKSVFVNGGNLLGTGAEVRKATLTINLVDQDARKQNQTQIAEEIGRSLALIPDMRYWFLKDNGQRSFSLVVAGRDGAAVGRVAADLTSQSKRATDSKGKVLLTNVTSTAELDRPELRVKPKTELAAELGITTDVISEAVRIATIGDVDANLAKLNIDDRQIPIRVELIQRARSNRQTLEMLKVATPSGAIVPLAQVAEFEISQGPTAIDRYDRQRRVLIGADLADGAPLGDALKAVLAQPAAKQLPAGVEIRQFGDVEIMAEVFSSFAKAMGLGLMMVYAVLVLLFGSFLQPITILFSLPLSIGGAIVALALTGQAVSMPVVIGILMLMGIVTKNAIMLVDFTIEQIARGMKRSDAIVDAGRKRARPIIMTTVAMVGGMLPATFNSGGGHEFRAPMAIAVIGGLISSTVLSLVFVPAVFAVLDDVAIGVWWVFGRFVGATDEPAPEAIASSALADGHDDPGLEAPRRIAAE